MAGVGHMRYSRFLFFNIFGGIGWVLSMTILGYYLGGIPIIRQHFEKVVLLIIFLSITPVIWHAVKARYGTPAPTPVPAPERD
jgi:membrane-associated protein